MRRKAVAGKPIVVGDRKEYWANDEAGQFYIALTSMPSNTAETAPNAPTTAASQADDDDEPATTAPARTDVQQLLDAELEGMAPISVPVPAQPIAAKMVIELAMLADGKTKTIDRVDLPNPLYAKSHALLLPQKLAVGEYHLSAWLEDAVGTKTADAQWTFKKSDKRGDVTPFPADGLPVTLEPIPDNRKLHIPIHLSIPLPRGTVKDLAELTITRNGRPVPAQLASTVHWGPTNSGASIRWALAKFTAEYDNGKADGYRLELKRTPAPASSVNITETADGITVDNGIVKFTVAKKRFTGIAKAWFDPTGNAKYNSPVVDGQQGEDSGPYLMDERLVKFTAAADVDTSVTVEEAGPESVTILATGWYADALKRVAPLCQYQVRMTLAAGASNIQIAHNTVITYDTRLHKLRNLGFGVMLPDMEQYAFGVDHAAVTGKLPQAAASKVKRLGEHPTNPAVFLHQKTWDLCAVRQEDGKSVEGKKSDGWVAVWSENKPVVSVTLRDIWEKFPKELEARKNGILVHAWPKNGKRVFTPDEELETKNIYKFWCFHQHPMLDLNLPQNYYEKLMTFVVDETKECRPEHALNGNGQGMTIGTKISLQFASPAIDKDPGAPELVAKCLADAKVFELDPFASLPADWNAKTQAVEPMNAVGTAFREFDDTILNGLLSYNSSVERGQEYGMFIWPDTHTYWLLPEGRASLHRVWQNSHYHQVGNSWVLWFRSGSAKMLRWARENSEHFRNVGTIAYAEPESRATSIMFHLPGAMYHCKGCTPWGTETPGMIRRDTHAGIWGHWVDSDAHLWAWLMDGDKRAQDLYALWVRSMKTYGYVTKGTRREANNTLAMIITAYETTGDADFLPAIWSLGLSLRTGEPLEAQNPGPMWHPLWINRYYHLTRDPEYVPFILKYGKSAFMGNTWNLALSALAHEVSGDKSYITQQLPSIKSFPRRVFRSPGHPYDNYGMGPGPLGMNWGEMGVGSFLREAERAGIKDFPADQPQPVGAYPATLGRKPQSLAYAYSAKGGDLEVKTGIGGVEGDVNKGEFILTSANKTLLNMPVAQATIKRVATPAKLEPNSLTTLTYEGYGTISMSTSGFDAQGSILENEKGYGLSRAYMFIDTLDAVGPTTFSFTASQPLGNDRALVSIILKDAAGATITDLSLHAGLNDKKTATLTVDPAKHPLPWTFDGFGSIRFSISSPTKKWIIAPTASDLKTMKPWIEKLAGPK